MTFPFNEYFRNDLDKVKIEFYFCNNYKTKLKKKRNNSGI